MRKPGSWPGFLFLESGARCEKYITKGYTQRVSAARPLAEYRFSNRRQSFGVRPHTNERSMNRVAIFYVTTLSLFLFLAQSACFAQQLGSLTPDVKHAANAAPKRILFVGNSYLYYNDSLHNHVGRIAGENGPCDVDDCEYKSATIGGARLSHHYIDSLLESGRLGIDEPFELVILQGGSGEVLTEKRRAQFRESAIELNQKIRATGAEVALYMTHAYVEPHERYDPGMFEKIGQTYIPVGNELNSLVIPVGLAFERAYEQRPEIVLHKTFDGTHPSLLGTYLAACVVYQSIYGKSVIGISYDYFGAIGQEDAKFLRGIADETVREFFARD